MSSCSLLMLIRIVLGLAGFLVIFEVPQWGIVRRRPETAFAIDREQKRVTGRKRNESISTRQSQFQQGESALQNKNAAVAVSRKHTQQQPQQGETSDKQSQRHQPTPNIHTPVDCIGRVLLSTFSQESPAHPGLEMARLVQLLRTSPRNTTIQTHLQ
jgi:hypothetical protein